jgi:hypothetical protein
VVGDVLELLSQAAVVRAIASATRAKNFMKPAPDFHLKMSRRRECIENALRDAVHRRRHGSAQRLAVGAGGC